MAGVACMTVGFVSRISLANPGPEAVASWPASTTVAPTVNGPKISSPAISNEMVVTASRISSPARPGRRAMAVRKFTREPWVISTPFGLPVEPEA
ncbi:MAG: hypothetical protein BECKG1743D_GA0114223_100222 [Candidatus Kentron sp. G]|nr:MAG: hypothetical protein BECKG1743F_GA0114225_100361 [Candidatus Kentron sp. G]VFM95801.1 MAG: hypothetical protein BECKG1743E_GA0114224_100194 [Candidatus Kentron sp. G]VFM97628.1 MAG: hypothetical protein BECKG1743D_GA0114223_100222 [Candidatus Kentron sp. G]